VLEGAGDLAGQLLGGRSQALPDAVLEPAGGDGLGLVASGKERRHERAHDVVHRLLAPEAEPFRAPLGGGAIAAL
jgi:hypothetical protein